jgi:alkanesulfonate monooxygenase SsuD/methylene tetrahydromethanopterin reductase-like flavin-dependent oxidoreductase (luciferase family)
MLMGQQLGSYTPSAHGNHWDTTLAAARACEQAGLDSVWLADHFMFPDKDNPEEVYNDPMPVQQPRPPIMIGGSGEKVTLRIAAQYADFCNVGGDPEMVAHKYDVLRQHCERLGRPYDAITRSNNVGILIAVSEREVCWRAARIWARNQSGPPRLVPPIIPKPPASETAAARSAPAVPAMGALRMGCSIVRRSQSRVRIIVVSLKAL